MEIVRPKVIDGLDEPIRPPILGQFDGAARELVFKKNEYKLEQFIDEWTQATTLSPLGDSFLTAVYWGCQFIVQILLDHGADINIQGGPRGNALQVAVAQGHETITKIILDRRPDINLQGGLYGNALQTAAYFGHRGIVQLLVDHGADVNHPGPSHGNALEIAVRQGNLSVARLLLGLGAEFNSIDGISGLSLEFAVMCREEALFQLLLDRGADVNDSCRYHNNVFHAAMDFEDEKSARLLLDRGAITDIQYDSNPSALSYFLERDAVSFSKGRELAERAKVESFVQLLLDYGFNVNAEGGLYGTALQAAAASHPSNEGVILLLLERGAQVNAQGGFYGNCLQAAVAKGNESTARLLLEHGADPTIQPWLPDHFSLLHLAVLSATSSILDFLLAHGAKLHIASTDSMGQTPLHLAVRSNNASMALCLLKNGASADETDFGDISILQAAIDEGNFDMARLIFSWAKTWRIIPAKKWRELLDSAAQDLEIVDGEKRQINPVPGLESLLSSLSYPKPFAVRMRLSFETNHFMRIHRRQRRMFIIAESLYTPGETSNLTCRMWSRVKDTDWPNGRDQTQSYSLWNVLTNIPPSVNSLRQVASDSCFLQCGFEFVYHEIHQISQDTIDFLDVHLGGVLKVKSLRWFMVKPDHLDDMSYRNSNLLRTCTFLHSTECTVLPNSILDLFKWLLEDIYEIWSLNQKCLKGQLADLRSFVLKSNGTNPTLIQLLIETAQLIDDEKFSLDNQLDAFQNFQSTYVSPRWRVVHELPFDVVEDLFSQLNPVIEKRSRDAQQEISNLSELCQRIIQLEFNLTAINETQKSTSANRSLKRLTWVTFIFLPLLFVATLFGMNIDILAKNPAWWWYPPLAILTLLVTVGVWLLFKRNNTLEGSLERRFNWLLSKGRNGQHKVDVEQARYGEMQSSNARTQSFSAFGKKRS